MSEFRHEYKYTIDEKQRAILLIRACGLLLPDTHAGTDGSYRIDSLYFDDIYDSCFYENENGVDYRSKFRIRCYNNDVGRIRLEKKSKIHGMVRKDSCGLTEDECSALMEGKCIGLPDCFSDMKKRLLTEIRLRHLMPKIIVSYVRYPFVYGAGNVRITFDCNISSSKDVGGFLRGTFASRPVMQAGESILEIKWDEMLPRHIREAFEIKELNCSAFSKYRMCRKYHL